MEAKNNRKSRQIKEWMSSFAFILPVMIGILVFTLFPMVSSLVYSFTRTYTTVKGTGEWIGLGNYASIFHEYWPEIGRSLSITFLFTVISLPLTLILSFGLSLLLTKDVKGIKVFRVIYYGGQRHFVVDACQRFGYERFQCDFERLRPSFLFVLRFGRYGNVYLHHYGLVYDRQQHDPLDRADQVCPRGNV